MKSRALVVETAAANRVRRTLHNSYIVVSNNVVVVGSIWAPIIIAVEDFCFHSSCLPTTSKPRRRRRRDSVVTDDGRVQNVDRSANDGVTTRRRYNDVAAAA